MIVYIVGAVLLAQIIHTLPNVISQLTAADSVAILIAIVATFIGLVSFITNIIDVTKFVETKSEILSRYNCEKLKDKVELIDFPELKALIILRSKQPNFKLSELFSPVEKTLTKEKMVQILYT